MKFCIPHLAFKALDYRKNQLLLFLTLLLLFFHQPAPFCIFCSIFIGKFPGLGIQKSPCYFASFVYLPTVTFTPLLLLLSPFFAGFHLKFWNWLQDFFVSYGFAHNYLCQWFYRCYTILFIAFLSECSLYMNTKNPIV